MAAQLAYTLPIEDLELASKGLDSHIRSLDGAKLLIAGGTGFIGVWLCETLAYAAHKQDVSFKTVLLTRDKDRAEHRIPHIANSTQFKLFVSDIRRFPSSDTQFDYVIHAAADSGAQGKSLKGIPLVDSIVDGTRNMLQIAVQGSAKRFLYLSSNAVYGRTLLPGYDSCDENYPGAPLVTDPNVDYDESKRMAEALCILANRESGLETVIARVFPIIGPYLPLDAHFAAGNFIRDALAGGPIKVNGDGTAVRSYIYAADLIRWLLALMFNGQPAHPYNVGGSNPVTTLELAQIAASCAESKCEVIVGQKPEPNAPVSRFVAKTERAGELGLRCDVSVEDAVRKTFEWYQRRSSHKSP